MSLSKLEVNTNRRLIFFDLETTGLNFYHNKIIEIGAIDNHGNKFEVLINPHCKLKPIIVKITGITQQQVDKYGIEEKDALEQFYDYIYDSKYRNKTFLVAHNAYGFDEPFLKHRMKKLGIKFSNSIKFIDTIWMAKYILPDRKSYRLESLCKHFNIKYGHGHRALEDTEYLKQLYLILCYVWKQRDGLSHSPIQIYNFIKSV